MFGRTRKLVWHRGPASYAYWGAANSCLEWKIFGQVLQIAVTFWPQYQHFIYYFNQKWLLWSLHGLLARKNVSLGAQHASLHSEGESCCPFLQRQQLLRKNWSQCQSVLGLVPREIRNRVGLPDKRTRQGLRGMRIPLWYWAWAWAALLSRWQSAAMSLRTDLRWAQL